MTALVLLALAVVAAALQGALSAEHLTGLGAWSCLLIGLFATGVAELVGVAWRPHEPSRSVVGTRPDGEPPFELPPPVQRAVLAAAFGFVGLIAFGNHATALLASAPDRMTLGSSDYCEEIDPADLAPEPAVVAAPARGCALLRRAYELGYADDLGECAPAEVEAAQTKLLPPICDRRQADEPLLHYTWRLLGDRTGDLAEADLGNAVGDQVAEVKTRLNYLDTLMASQAHAIRSDPRASHHLFTNLPPPSDSSWLGELVAPKACGSLYDELEIELDWSDRSRPRSALLDHAWGQLLFAPAFGTPAGYCREYTIHWNSDPDLCGQLVEAPARVLEEHDALEPIEAVLDRRRRHIERRRLDLELEGRSPLAEAPPAHRIVSLQCLMFVPAGDGQLTSNDVTLAGQTLPVRQLRSSVDAVAGAAQLVVFDQLATVLTGARYTGPAGERAVVAAVARGARREQVTGTDFALTRLEHLRDADPFTTGAWPLDEAELAEVYPIFFHLRAFIDSFRRRYAGQRGRL